MQMQEREYLAQTVHIAQVKESDVSATNKFYAPGGVPSISIRLVAADVLRAFKNNPYYENYSDDNLINLIKNYLTYTLQNHYSLYFLSVNFGDANKINISNAFSIINPDQIDNSDSTDTKALYNKLRKEVATELQKILAQLSKNNFLIQDFLRKISNNVGWNEFIAVRTNAAEKENLASILEVLNEEFKPYFQDGEFLSLDNYSIKQPAIYLYDSQCRVICMFSLTTGKGIIEHVVKQFAAITLEAEKIAAYQYSKDNNVNFSKGETALTDFSHSYIRNYYADEMTVLVENFSNSLAEIKSEYFNSAYDFILTDLKEMVFNRFYNGFVIGFFLSNEKAFNASLTTTPPVVRLKQLLG